MKLSYADKELTGDILLYPLQGFLLLCVPVGKNFSAVDRVVLGSQFVILVTGKKGRVFSINKHVMGILMQQSKLLSKNPNVLGVIGIEFSEELNIDEINFAPYQLVEAYKNELTEAQIKKLTKEYGVIDNVVEA